VIIIIAFLLLAGFGIYNFCCSGGKPEAMKYTPKGPSKVKKAAKDSGKLVSKSATNANFSYLPESEKSPPPMTRESLYAEFQAEDPLESWKNCSYHFTVRKRRNPLTNISNMSGGAIDAIMNAPSKINAHALQFVCNKVQKKKCNRIHIEVWRAKDPSKPVQKVFSGKAGTIKLDTYVKRIKLPDRRRGNEPWEMNRVNIHFGTNSFGIFGRSSLRACNRWWYYNHDANCIIGDQSHAPHRMHPFEHFLRTCLKLKAQDPQIECVFEGFPEGGRYDDPDAVDQYLRLFFGSRLDTITPYGSPQSQ